MNKLIHAKLCIFEGKKIDSIGEAYRIKALGYGTSKETIEQSIYKHYDHISSLEIIDIKNLKQLLTLSEVYYHFNNGNYPDMTNDRDDSYSIGNDKFKIGIDTDGVIDHFRVYLTDELYLSSQFRDKKYRISFSNGIQMKGYGFRSTKATVEPINVSIEKSSAQIIKDINNRIFTKQAENIALVMAELKELRVQEDNTKVLEDQVRKLADSYNGTYWYKGYGLKTQSGQIYFDVRQKYLYFSTIEATMAAIEALEECDNKLKALKGE
jgi:SepF-like predicted cell division protein (DUF552 family)